MAVTPINSIKNIEQQIVDVIAYAHPSSEHSRMDITLVGGTVEKIPLVQNGLYLGGTFIIDSNDNAKYVVFCYKEIATYGDFINNISNGEIIYGRLFKISDIQQVVVV